MKKRILSMLIAMCMVLTLLPSTAFATEGIIPPGTSSKTDNNKTVCLNHKEHDDDCGYMEAVAGTVCAHLNEDGTYSCFTAEEAAPALDSSVSGNAVASDAEKQYACDHDDACGYTKAVKEKPCTHVCGLCKPVEKPMLLTGTLAADVTGNGYSFDKDTGALTITSNAGTTAWRSDKNIAVNSADYAAVQSVTIENGVTSIGNYAFYNCSGLTAITIPVGMTTIGYGAFGACTALTSLTIPEGVATIGEYAFQACSQLDSITIPDSVTSIGNYTFQECTKLATVTFESTAKLETIGNNAFDSCGSLITITIPEGVTDIGNNAFYNCSNLAEVICKPVSPPLLGTNVFGSNASSLRIEVPNASAADYKTAPNWFTWASKIVEGTPGTVITGNGYSFNKDTGALTITSDAGTTAWRKDTNIATDTDYTAVQSVSIESGVKSLGKNAFSGCSSLTSITMPEGMTTIGINAFSGCRSLTSLTLPEGVTSIGNYAFSYCSSLTSITIPNSVTSIGDEAFHNCSRLTSITIPEGVTSIGAKVFYNCSSLTTVTIQKGVTTIGNNAFDSCVALTSLTLPESVTTIGSNAFARCTGLTSLTIPEGVTTIGDSAFLYCPKLVQVICKPATPPQIGTDVFKDAAAKLRIKVPDAKVDIYKEAPSWSAWADKIVAESAELPPLTGNGYLFYEETGSLIITTNEGTTAWRADRNIVGGGTGNMSVVKSVTIKDGVTDIGRIAFSDCSNLTSITIPEGVTYIGGYAFYSCTSLTSITLPTSVTTLAGCVFQHCSSLTAITMPDGVTLFGNNTFDGCSSLTSITIPAGITIIDTGLFRNCSALTSITIPAGVTSIRGTAFNGCSGLTTITIPEGVTYIGTNTFDGCSSLTSITIPASVTFIDSDAFNGCSQLAEVICKNPTPPRLSTGVFTGSAPSLKIKVRNASVDSYKQAANWSTWKDYIEGGAPDTVITIAAISGVTAPVKGAAPVTAITETAQYTGTVTWSPTISKGKFAPDTVYTAQITLMTKEGYTLTGVAQDFFTVAVASSVSSPVNSGVITAVFPKTEVDLVAITGTAAYGSELTVDISNLLPLDPGTLSYQWKRGNDVIGTGSTYTCVKEDIGKSLSCKVAGTNLSEAFEVSSDVIEKADVSNDIQFAPADLTYNKYPRDCTPASLNGKTEGFTYSYVADTASDPNSFLTSGKPQTKGVYRATASYESDTAKGSATASFLILPKKLTITAYCLPKTYDGSTEASVMVKHDEVVFDSAYDLSAYASQPQFKTPDAGTNKPLQPVEIKLAGYFKMNYIPDKTTIELVGTVNPKPVTPVIASIADQTFTGTQLRPDVTVTADSKLLTSDQYAVTYAENITAGTGAGKATVTLKGNYSGTADAYFNISKASAPVIADNTFSVAFGDTDNKTHHITGLPSGMGSTTYTMGSVSDTKSLLNISAVDAASGAVSFSLKPGLSAANKDNTAVIPVVVNSRNYDPFTVNLVITIADKTDVSSSITFTDGSAVYNGAGQEYKTASYQGSGDSFTYTYATTDGTLLNGIPKGVGTYTVTAVYDSATNVGRKTAVFTISQKDVTVSVSCTGKVYDGTTDAVVSYTVNGKADTDDVTAGGTALYNNKNAGADRTVTATNIRLSGTDASNYNLTAATATTTAAITSKVITPTIEAIPAQPFTGNQLTPAVTVKDGGTTLILNTDYTVNYGTNINAANNAGQVTVTLKGNYFGKAEAYFTISKAAAPTVSDNNVCTAYADTANKTHTLTGLPENLGTAAFAKGTVTDTDSILSGDPTVDSSTGALSYQLVSGLTEAGSKTATIGITVTSTNYESFTLNVVIKLTDKTDASSSITFADGTAAYTGAVCLHETAAISGQTGGSMTYSYSTVNGVLEGGKPKGAGTYTITAVYDSTTAFGSKTVTFTIMPKEVTVKAENKSINKDEAVPSLTILYTGFAGTDSEANTLTTEAAVSCTADGKTAGSFPITFSTAAVLNDAAGKNYTLKHEDGVLEVKNNNTGGGGSSSGSSDGSITFTPPAQDKPNTPTQGEIKLDGKVEGGNTAITVTDKNVTDAFDKALDDAKKNGNESNGITLVLKVGTGGKTVNSVTVNLPKTAQETIIRKKIVSIIVVVDQPDIVIGMDLATVTEINKQAGADVNITATRKDRGKLTGKAKTAVGSRPVFELGVSTVSGKAVQNFGAGSVSVTIPYTLAANEKAGNVQAVYLDGSGRVQWLTSSVYDSKGKVLRFSTNHFSTYAVGYRTDAPVLADIASHWAKDDIQFVVNRKLLAGTSATTFSPNTAMTHGMLVTALGRLANADVSGGTNGKFSPNASITREQMAVIMSNYAKVIGYVTPKVHAENTFADSAKIGAYAKDAVKQMQMAGVLAGKSGNVFDPQGTATRAEVSAVLRRFVELSISSGSMQGWTMNDSGQWMYYQDGKPVTGKRDIDGASYTFDQYGVTADVQKNLKYTTYTVKKGDSFWLIAHKLGCSMSDLERLNNKRRFDIIYTGNVLRVPEK